MNLKLRSLALILPLSALLAGCSSSEPEETVAPAANATPTSAAPVPAVTEEPGRRSSDATSEAPKAELASTATYGKEGDMPGMPGEMSAAKKKYAVPPPPATMKIAPKTRVKLVTNKGSIVVEVDGKAAPLQAKSFIYLVNRKFYDGVQFHRYEPGFVIQGGDPFTKDASLSQMYGSGGPGYTVPRETNNLKHDTMALAAARTSDPDSAGSQFYFTLDAAHFLDQDQAQDGYGYVVFGRVLSGKDVVLKLRANDKIKSARVIK